MYSVYFKKKTERSDSILPHSTIRLPHSSNVVSYKRRLWPRASSLIEKETDERRTSNIERPTSNNEFYQFKKRLSEATSTIRQLSFVIRHSMKFHTRCLKQLTVSAWMRVPVMHGCHLLSGIKYQFFSNKGGRL